jgi:futalosine hydrolase
MFLLVTPTDKELDALQAGVASEIDFTSLVCGVGPLESSVVLHKFLSGTDVDFEGVLLAGIGGAFVGGGADILDVCLATSEVFGDIGICYPDRIEPLDHSFAPQSTFIFNPNLLASAGRIFSESKVKYREGVFVTVSSVSGTKIRGDYLQNRFSAICENMEGAGIARVCQEFNLPCLEVRCISNMVLDRAEQVWDVDGALGCCSKAVGLLLGKLACES